ncbi:hypothetical protein AVEN_69298-1 [Araneus ventricosus]|uniref:Uncharacterized protein n=1 Tax=Araneus ventricosus TaxID=182803 RepID=A0A4Y2GM38_ARAVE|nr:hypothetical protein AVEN_69298-1 [Araneus ventricosus]
MDLVNLSRSQLTRTTLELEHSSLNFCITPAGGRLIPTYDLTANKTTNTANLKKNRISSLQPFGSEAETLPQGQLGQRNA